MTRQRHALKSRVQTRDQIIAGKDKVLGAFQNMSSKALTDEDGSRLKLANGNKVFMEKCMDDRKAHVTARSISNPGDESDESEQEHGALSRQKLQRLKTRNQRERRRRKRASHNQKKADPKHLINSAGSSSATSVPEQATASSEGPEADQNTIQQDEQPPGLPNVSLPPTNPASTPSLVPASGPIANIPTPSIKPICMD